jgi:putative nucleotidyltransferase with HDIG domain
MNSVRLTLDDILKRANAIPALPQIVTRILDTLDDESANTDTLSEQISGEPAVVAKLLGAANAGAFGGHHVQSLKQAILLLGVGRVKEITVATAIIDRYTAEPPFDAHALWLHSIGVAACAREVALHAGLDVEISGIAGLLHDIGQLLLFGVEPKSYIEALNYKQRHNLDIIAAEREILGVDHAQAGGALARLWKLPPHVGDAIAGHHMTDMLGVASEIADVVHVAEVLSHALDLSQSDTNRVPLLSEMSCARLGIDWMEFAGRFPRIEARFNNARATLGL